MRKDKSVLYLVLTFHGQENNGNLILKHELGEKLAFGSNRDGHLSPWVIKVSERLIEVSGDNKWRIPAQFRELVEQSGIRYYSGPAALPPQTSGASRNVKPPPLLKWSKWLFWEWEVHYR